MKISTPLQNRLLSQPLRSQMREPVELTEATHGWVSRSKRTRPETIHDAVEKNQLQMLRRFLQEEPEAAQSRDAFGQTPLHLAAAQGNLNIVEELVAHGVDLWAMDNDGLTAVDRAAESGYGPMVLWLLNVMREQPHSSEPWYKEEQVDQMITEVQMARAKPAKASLRSVADALTMKLTGADQEWLDDRNELYTYISHLNSWVGHTLRDSDEGWFYDSMLVQRIRSLCYILSAPKSLPQFDSEGLDQGGVRQLLVRQLTSMLNTLQVARKMDCLYPTRRTDVASALSLHNALDIAGSLNQIKPGQSLVLPIGFPGHAIYMGIERRQDEKGAESLVFDINNLGAGFGKSHEALGSERVLPRVFRIPLEDPKVMPALTKLLVDFLKQIISCRIPIYRANWDQLYHVVSSFERDLAKLFPSDSAADDSIDYWQSMKMQTAGNCVLKNHSATMVKTLGRSLFKWVKNQEKIIAQNHPKNVVNQELYKDKEFEKHEKTLNYLMSGPMKELHRYLRKPRPEGIAAWVDADQLAKVVTHKDDMVLAHLIRLGADPFGLDAHDRSLLDYAVRVGASACVRILLEAGISPNGQDASGRTPLHTAVVHQDQAMVELLMQHGADPTVLDQGGRSPEQLLEQRQNQLVDIAQLLQRNAMRA